MRRMIDLVKQSAIPANMMRNASRGALSVEPGEMVEILVFLSSHATYGVDAQLTLAGWNENDLKAILADPETPIEVLEYFLASDHLRMPLLKHILGNQNVDEDHLVRIAMQASLRILANMLWHPRVLASSTTLHAILMNVNLPEQDASIVHSAIAALEKDDDEPIEVVEDPNEAVVTLDEVEAELTRFQQEHAAEIEAEEGKEFEMFADVHAVADPDRVERPSIAPAGEADPSFRRKVTAFQKIAKLSVGERVQLAMKGNKDERFILVRDGAKVVSAAVLESPKVTDQEVEMFSNLKNIQESVLRRIASKRKYMKSYVVQKNLVNNPRAPLDVTMPLVKNLMINDLRAMAGNKNVNDTLRKMAFKLYRQRTDNKKHD